MANLFLNKNCQLTNCLSNSKSAIDKCKKLGLNILQAGYQSTVFVRVDVH